jgi:hypothetical protein
MPLQSGSLTRAALIGLAALSLTSVGACGHMSGGTGAYGGSGGGGGGSVPRGGSANQIGVNSYLWRATLDTLAFMPLSSADPYGGVVITDWYVVPEKPDERFKCTVYILDTRLRGDAIKGTVFKEVSNGAGGWSTSPVADQTSEDIENSILTRARQLRLSNARG